MNPILEEKDRILKIWRDRVRADLPAAKGQSRLALDDSIPEFLQNLGERLEKRGQPQAALAEQREDLIGKIHGQHRANNRYSIDQIIGEYFILKDVIFDVLRKAQDFNQETCDIVDHSFRRAIEGSASQFSQALLESRENFVMALSHDLRSPLMSIKLQTELMERRGNCDPLSAQKILASAQKMDLMISHLLETMKARNHISIISDFSSFDFLELVRKICATYEDQYPNLIRIQGQSVTVNWNRSAMERVLENLLSNAFKFGEENTPVTLRVDADEVSVFFSVHNQGPAIPEKEQINLFQRFSRSERHKDKPGWGIGLSYVKSVIEAHRGVIFVKSDENGTVFKFELPREIRASEEEISVE